MTGSSRSPGSRGLLRAGGGLAISSLGGHDVHARRRGPDVGGDGGDDVRAAEWQHRLASDGSYVRCDIQDKGWQPPPKPADCSVGWGYAVTVGDMIAGFDCAGDTVFGTSAKLEYGHAVRDGSFRCTSRETGVRCEHTRTSHAFELAKESYRLF